MATVKLKPAKEGQKTRDPKNMDFLPDDGRTVELNAYWQRRIESKEVVVVDEKLSQKKAGN